MTKGNKYLESFRNFIQIEVLMIENFLAYYSKSDGVTNKKILNTIFDEKLIVVWWKIAIPVFTVPIQLIVRISEVMRRTEKKKEVDLNQSLVATLTKNPIFRI